MMACSNWLGFGRLLAILTIGLAACGDDGSGPAVTDTGSDADAGDTTPDQPDGDDPEVDTGPGELLCRPCLGTGQCDDDANLCINLPSGESVCGLDCSASEEVCPEGYFCAQVSDFMQCVPEALYCINQCGDPPRECDEGEFCDPLTGQCGPPRGPCERCDVDAQCGDGNLCLTFPDIDSFRGCGLDCSQGQECPTDYVCAQVGPDATVQQCVPEILTCIDRCVDVECTQDLACDPLTGDCIEPLGLCDDCIANFECGGETDLCLALPDGNAYCGRDCGLTAIDPECPPGYVCQALGAGVSQCVPSLLTCVDHCVDPSPVECPEGQNCNPLDGTCHTPTVGLCQRPCDDNYECGGQEDLCIAVEGSLGATFCSRDCGTDDPCPIGYSCFPLTDGLRSQCAPSSVEADCGPCLQVACPEGEYCRPVDGSCLPPPAPCQSNDECAPDEVCNIFEDRCEPLGLPCRFDEFGDCTFDSSCSATSFGMEGTCLLNCFARPEGCPDHRPDCQNYDEIFVGVCVELGLGGPERCGRLISSAAVVGRPCPDSEEVDGCPDAAPACLSDVIDGIPGFCTDTCDPTAETPCAGGERCARVPGTLEAYCLPDICTCMAVPELDVGEEDALQTALDGLDLSRCDVGYNQAERDTAGLLVANDPYRIEGVGELRNEALRGAEWVRRHLEVLGQDGSLGATIRLAAADLGFELKGEPPDFSGTSFCDAIVGLFAGSEVTPPTCGDLSDEEAALPAEIVAGLAEAIATAGWAAGQRDLVLPDDLTAERFDALLGSLHRLLLPDGTAPPNADANRDLLLQLKIDTLYQAAASLADILDSVAITPDADGPADIVTISTPLGAIVIEGDADHTYCATEGDCNGALNPVILDEPVLLFIDTGGDDTYRIPAGSTLGLDDALSVFIDLGGNDDYGYLPGTSDPIAGLPPADEAERAGAPAAPLSLSTIGRQGSARGGIAFLIDRGQGADHYQSLRLSQGFGMLGVGALVDDGCEELVGETPTTCADDFDAESLSQGAGLFGIGILLTGANHATFDGLNLVQGAAGPRGVGLLVNAGGDDDYTALAGTDESILVGFDRGLDRVAGVDLEGAGNWSAAQGAGQGVPSETPAEGGNLSGGIGLLIDLAGADSYLAGVGAQGTGYWHGLGGLIDSDGDDDYETHGFGQGSGLTFGVGILADQAGLDEYNPDADSEPRVLGSGNDFGVGLAIEEGGQDHYYAGAQSLGMGYLNGTGVFIDTGGNDTYTLTSPDTLGKASLSLFGAGARETARTVGLFVDAGGTDTYEGRSLDSPTIGNGTSWVQTGSTPENAIQYGVGADREGGTGVTTIP